MKVPSYIKQRITETGGRSVNGRPLFRILWGAERMCWAGGPWKKFDVNGNEIGTVIEERKVPKYPTATERFIFESWFPPEWYGTEQKWQEDTVKTFDGITVHTVGPFPRDGDYELLKVLETPRGNYVPLTATIVDALIATAQMNRQLSKNARVAILAEQREKETRAAQSKRDSILDECAGARFTNQPHIIVPDLKEVKAYG